MIADKIEEYLRKNELVTNEQIRYEVEKMAGVSFKRQFQTDAEPVKKGVIRLSASGRCPRQNAYAFHGFEKNGKELDGRARITFWMGDCSENLLSNLAKLAGVQLMATGLQQDEILFNVNGSVIKGHPDGYLWNEDELWLVEFKSMSSFSFARFEKGEIDDGYIAQINAYLNKRKSCVGCVLCAINKDNGVVKEQIVYRDESVVDKVRKNLLAVLHSTPEQLPPPPPELEPDSKGFYPWNCLYCSYRGHCRTNSEVVLVKNSNKLRVRKEQ